MAEANKLFENLKSEENDAPDEGDAPSTTSKENTVRRLNVYNLSGKVTKTNLQNMFSLYGKLESTNVSKKSRGIISADITFVDSNDALKVLAAADKKEIRHNGKILNIVPAFVNTQLNKNQNGQRKGVMKKRDNKKQKKASTTQDNNSDHSDYINKLDDDCLIHIFLKLPIIDRLRIERVCKRWQDVSARAWHDIKELNLSRSLLENNPQINLNHVNNRAVEKILIRCGRFLTYLKLSTNDLGCNADILQAVGDHCQNVDKLVLQLTKHASKNLQRLFSQTKKVQYLEMKDLGKDFRDECLTSLSPTLKELHLLAKTTDDKFSTCYRRLNRLVSSVFRKWKNFTSLALNGFLLKPEKIKAICDSKNITSLSLANCTVKKSICKICNLSNLTYLNLYKVPEVSNQLLTRLSTQCSQLQYLNISYCTSVTNTGIMALAKLTNLQTLYVNELMDISDDALRHLVYLETLHCENCEMIGDIGICTLIETAPNLKLLNIFNCTVTHDILVSANAVLKRRTNNVPLHIIVNSSVTDDWELENYERTPLLTIESKDDSLWDEFWNSDDDDDDDDDESDDFYRVDADDDDGWGLDGFEHDYDSDYDFDHVFDCVVGNNPFLLF